MSVNVLRFIDIKVPLHVLSASLIRLEEDALSSTVYIVAIEAYTNHLKQKKETIHIPFFDERKAIELVNSLSLDDKTVILTMEINPTSLKYTDMLSWGNFITKKEKEKEFLTHPNAFNPLNNDFTLTVTYKETNPFSNETLTHTHTYLEHISESLIPFRFLSLNTLIFFDQFFKALDEKNLSLSEYDCKRLDDKTKYYQIINKQENIAFGDWSVSIHDRLEPLTQDEIYLAELMGYKGETSPVYYVRVE